jgi:hypothetical protein
MAILVDAQRVGVERSGIIEGGVDTAVVEEATQVAVAVGVIPNDLSRGVDAFRKRAAGAKWIVKAVGGKGIVEGGVGGAVGIVEKPVRGVGVVEVNPDDQSRAVDPVGLGVVVGQRIVEGGVGAAVGVVEESVRAGVVDVPADDRPAPLSPYA